MDLNWLELIVAMLAAALLLLGEHYWIRCPLSLPARYVLGVLALILPLSGLFVAWAAWKMLVALWTVTASGGMTVLISYAIDHWHQTMALLAIAEREGQALRDSLGSEGETDGPKEE
jgi:hypothetical protein